MQAARPIRPAVHLSGIATLNVASPHDIFVRVRNLLMLTCFRGSTTTYWTHRGRHEPERQLKDLKSFRVSLFKTIGKLDVNETDHRGMALPTSFHVKPANYSARLVELNLVGVLSVFQSGAIWTALVGSRKIARAEVKRHSDRHPKATRIPSPCLMQD